MFAVDLSPKKWEEIFFQDSTVKALRGSIQKDSAPNNVLLSGLSGLGKSSLSKVYAAALVCEHKQDGNPCGVCVSCLDIFNGTFSRNVRQVNGITDNGIAFYREVISSLYNEGSLFGDKKVLIIDEVHGLSDESLQAFLMPAESQNNDVYLIFTTTELAKIKNTLADRCLSFSLRIPSELDIAKYISYCVNEKLKLRVPKEFTAEGVIEIAFESSGSLRKALHLLEKIYLSKDYSSDNIHKLIEDDIDKIVFKGLNYLLADKVPLAIYELELIFSSLEPYRAFNKMLTILIDLYKIKVKSLELNRPVYTKALNNNFKDVDIRRLPQVIDRFIEIKGKCGSFFDKHIFIYELLRGK